MSSSDPSSSSHEIAKASSSEIDILKEHHQFIRSSSATTWEDRLARNYDNKLFKEFALINLKHYKSSRIALRWRTRNEVIVGKGQCSCANVDCDVDADLVSWEVPFGYIEHGEKKMALVKVRLCPKCSTKLNCKSTHSSGRRPDESRDHSPSSPDTIQSHRHK